MLSEKYKNALNGFKAQGAAPHLFTGCEAEAQHIYRIIMTEEVPVDQLDEAMLAKFIDKESLGNVDYSKYVDRDGLKYADLEQDVEVYPTVMRGAATYPIEGQSYRLSSHDAKSMLNQLRQIGQLCLITETMQGLAERLDGTKLQTAFPSLQEVTDCIAKGLVLPESLLDKLKEWETLGAAEVNFDFVEQV
jgi:hypothetical protein